MTPQITSAAKRYPPAHPLAILRLAGPFVLYVHSPGNGDLDARSRGVTPDYGGRLASAATATLRILLR